MERLMNLLDRLRRTALPRPLTLPLLAAAVCAPLTLFYLRLAKPTMAWDDFPLVRDAVNWQRTCDNLWTPFATHFCPLFRLLTWALVAAAGRLSYVPDWLRWSSVVGHVLVMLCLFVFVQRQSRSAWLGIGAVILAGMTTVYSGVGLGGQHWGSGHLFAMSFVLLTLLCLQAAVAGGRWRWWWLLMAAAGAAAVAPSWYAGGLVAGPLGAAYAWLQGRGRAGRARLVMATAAPLVGTALFVAVALAVAGQDILAASNFGDRSPWRAFRPHLGLYLTARVMTEHLLWTLGLRQPIGFVHWLALCTLLAAVAVYWFKRARDRTLAATGLLLMLGSCLLVYSFRSYMSIGQARAATWYLFFPHIGWSMFVCAGVEPRLRPEWLRVQVAAEGHKRQYLEALLEQAEPDRQALLARWGDGWPSGAEPAVAAGAESAGEAVRAIRAELARTGRRLEHLRFRCRQWLQGASQWEQQLSAGQAAALALLAGVLFALHKPAADRAAQSLVSTDQLPQLSQLELIESVSRRWQIEAATLQKAIGPFYIGGGGTFDGLSLIEPPRTGRPWDPKEVRRRLNLVLESGSPAAFDQPPKPRRDRRRRTKPADK